MKYVDRDSNVFEAEPKLEVIRHTTSHIMAQAVKRLYPNVPIDRDTVRNHVQHAYDFDIKNSQPKANVKLDGSNLASHKQSVLGSTNVIADSIDKK